MAFNPSEPRDKEGKWTRSGGNGGSSGGKGPSRGAHRSASHTSVGKGRRPQATNLDVAKVIGAHTLGSVATGAAISGASIINPTFGLAVIGGVIAKNIYEEVTHKPDPKAKTLTTGQSLAAVTGIIAGGLAGGAAGYFGTAVGAGVAAGLAGRSGLRVGEGFVKAAANFKASRNAERAFRNAKVVKHIPLKITKA